MNNDVVGLLLDDAMPPERLGELLRAARKRRGWKRRDAAAKVGIEPRALREFEAGMASIPADVCARLAECYGDDLTAHVPLRVPVRLEDRWLTTEGDAQVVASPAGEDVLQSYAQLLTRVRSAKAGEPLALRATDLAVLSDLLGRDDAYIEARIAALLGCTEVEAAELRASLLRRKVILPVAGLAAGVALFAAAQAGTSTAAEPTNLGPARETSITIVEAAPSAAPDIMPNLAPEPVNLAPIPVAVVEGPVVETPPPAPAADPAPVVAPAPLAATPPAPLQVALTDATVPPAPVDDPPVSILPGENFQIIEIGTPAVEELPSPE